jgi:uncharacterized membrane protein YbaN (DUF454 family)
MRVGRPLYFGLGVVCVGLGYLGAILPLMPSTVFFLIALWSFQKSSPKFEQWLLERPVIGPTLTDWRETRSIRPRTKVVAIASIWVTMAISGGIMVARQRPLYIPALLAAVGVGVSWYIATRPSTADVPTLTEAV